MYVDDSLSGSTTISPDVVTSETRLILVIASSPSRSAHIFGVGVGVAVGIGVGVGVAVGIGVGVGVAVGIGVGVGVAVGVGVGIDVGSSVGVGRGLAVGVLVGSAVGVVALLHETPASKITTTAKALSIRLGPKSADARLDSRIAPRAVVSIPLLPG